MDNHRETLNRMWHIMTDGLEYSDTGKYDKWLEKKGYCPRTVHLYDLMMRRVENENLTPESVGVLYKDYSSYTRTELRYAIRQLEEYYADMG